MTTGEPAVARRVHVSGTVQGVGFRPYVFRLAQTHGLAGWVCNGGDGVDIHIEGAGQALEQFLHVLPAEAPLAAEISALEVCQASPLALQSFVIRPSVRAAVPITRIAPDLAICEACLHELFDAVDRRHGYPFINCTDCGPRFSIVTALPYDRPNTTMAEWPLCSLCAAEYHDPANRRFHAQPVACPDCGPGYRLVRRDCQGRRPRWDSGDAIAMAADLLVRGAIVGVKGIGGYHLACDATNAAAVLTLRQRKVREEKPFALMVRDLEVARQLAVVTPLEEEALRSAARPIVLCTAAVPLIGVAPDNPEFGLMLPYAPLHHLLFASGAPPVMVMTSGNRSEEPIAFRDDDAEQRLCGIADALLVGERAIARRIDDSIVRATGAAPMILRRARGYAPGVVARIPSSRPILAVGGDLKNAVTLVIDGQAYCSQHIGNLEQHEALTAFRQTIAELLAMYGVNPEQLLVAHDRHPQYRSSLEARAMPAFAVAAVQHHQAHVASVLAERGELDREVIGVAFDGTGYGDDGTIWGGEFFAGSVREGFQRVAGLHPARLPGGDAAARMPVQAAAGFLAALETSNNGIDFTRPPFGFPSRFSRSQAVLSSGVRVFTTTSAGRLFDAVAALLGFVRPVTFEGQAAMWLEHLAGACNGGEELPVGVECGTLDWRPTLQALVDLRLGGVEPAELARRFHRALAEGIVRVAEVLAARHEVGELVLSGGVFQNVQLTRLVTSRAATRGLRVLTNLAVPANDGGLSLGQAALAAAALGRG